MRVDVSEGLPGEDWAVLPAGDRILVGGHTVWTGSLRRPVLVSQPNRWGVVESDFPDLPCLVEADPQVTGHLPLPSEVVGFVDRTHRPIDPPTESDSGRRLLQTASRLARRLIQIRGVKVAASPFARTIPLLTPRDTASLISECEAEGLVGLRSLPGLGGGITLSVRVEHGPEELDRIVDVLARLARR